MEETRRKYRSPLFRRLLTGSLAFVLLLCSTLGVSGYFLFKTRMMTQYRDHLNSAIRLSAAIINVDNLKHIIETYEPDEYYGLLINLFDSSREAYELEDIVLTRIEKDGDDYKVIQIISGLLPDEREGKNLKNIAIPVLGEDYGGIFTKEFREYLYNQFMNSREIEYAESKNEFGNTYNAAYTIRDAAGEPVAQLSAGLSLAFIEQTMNSYLFNLLVITIVLGLLFMISIMQWLRIRVLDPVRKIEKAATDFEARSQKAKNPDAFVLDMPKLGSGDELESLASTLGNMSLSMKNYAEELLESAVKVDILELDLEESKKKAMKLTELATKDSLTGIRNKTAYTQEVERIKDRLDGGDTFFGVAMIDMNGLKKINDVYGHEKGDIAIRKLCSVVCQVFEHSPVFRVGGDEFVVILRGSDYDCIASLAAEFSLLISEVRNDESLDEWERVDAAIGYALFDQEKDSYYEDVFVRADKEMYRHKAEMKAGRT